MGTYTVHVLPNVLTPPTPAPPPRVKLTSTKSYCARPARMSSINSRALAMPLATATRTCTAPAMNTNTHSKCEMIGTHFLVLPTNILPTYSGRHVQPATHKTATPVEIFQHKSSIRVSDTTSIV